MSAGRWVLALLALAVLWKCSQQDEPPPVPIEDTFMGDTVEAKQRAQGYEQDYLDATRQRQQQMEEQLERDNGGN